MYGFLRNANLFPKCQNPCSHSLTCRFSAGKNNSWSILCSKIGALNYFAQNHSPQPRLSPIRLVKRINGKIKESSDFHRKKKLSPQIFVPFSNPDNQIPFPNPSINIRWDLSFDIQENEWQIGVFLAKPKLRQPLESAQLSTWIWVRLFANTVHCYKFWS